MSATEDATRPTDTQRPPSAWRRVTGALLVGALLGAGLPAAGLLGVLPGRFALGGVPLHEARVRWQGGPPAPGEWPRPVRAGEQAVPFTDGDRTLLAVRSFTAAGTETLARDLQRWRLSGVEASSARRVAARGRWRSELVPRGTVTLPPAGRCAVLLRARLLLVVLVDPQVPVAAPRESQGSAARRARLARAEAEVVRLGLSVRPDSLAWALTACAAAEGEWLRALAAEPSSDPRVRIEAAWRWHERSYAPVLDRAERALEASLSRSQNDGVVTAAYSEALSLERLAPDPCAALFVHGAWGPMPTAFPIVRTWVVLLAAGALAGAALALALCGPWLWPRSRSRVVNLVRGVPAALSAPASGERFARLSRDPRRAWDAELGWLHLVSGPDPARIAHAVSILAGGFTERGERVLLVDAGRRLRLHERYGGDARWGLGECLAGEVPLLGAVQAAGRSGFFFLAHGVPGRAGRWDELSGLLEDARAHFDRVLLALDPKVSNAAALPLGGRVLEAWWAEPGPGLSRNAVALSERLGIPFTCFDLNWLMEAMREAVPAAPERIPGPPLVVDEVVVAVPPACLAEAEAAAPADADALSVVVAEAPAVEEVEAPPLAEVGPGEETCEPGVAALRSAGIIEVAACSDDEAVVLGCDLEVRERLRFMVWMRRVRAERRAAALETSASH